MSTVPTLFGVTRRHDETLVAELIRQVDPELSRVSDPLSDLLYQLVEHRRCRGSILTRRFLIEVRRLQIRFSVIAASSSSAEYRTSAAREHSLGNVVTVLLEVHYRLGDFQINRPHEHLYVERTEQSLGNPADCLCKEKLFGQLEFT